MTTDTAKSILGALICQPCLLESADDLAADLFAGHDKRVFLAISDIWAEARPDKIDISLLAKRAGLDLMAVSGLMDYALVVQPDGLRHLVAGLVKSKLAKEIMQKVSVGAAAGQLDDALAEIRPLLHKYEVADDKEKRLAEQVRRWVEEDAHGEFNAKQIYADLAIQSTGWQANVRQLLARMVKEGLLDYAGHKTGWYRKVGKLAEPIDLTAVEAAPISGLYLPLGLGELVNIYPKSVIVCSGASQQGKTAVAIDMVKHNMETHDVRYYFVEGGPEELKSRVVQHTDTPIEKWGKMLAFEHAGYPADVIAPDAINVYDYLKVSTEGLWRVDDMLTDVHKKLRGGIAFINLQKDTKRELGDGGEFGLRIPRLYFTLNPDPDRSRSMDKQAVIAKVIKAKGWRQAGKNPDGRIMPFTIRDGWKISHGTEWVYPESLCAAKTTKRFN